ncbi:glycosyltransferase family 4 protein [Neptuniibacter marinus]|uniref:glycosyltransferase family 4 protein n=1 Tax=Neptuniibacter marinus TaxID=1806670 RepID=UPI000835FEA9|nr:glycosyltransferase family 4 protein [Neptuniibacter marinus]
MADENSKKTYWLINQYASTPESGMGGRHYYLAKELAKQGHRVYLIGAGFTHLLRQPPRLVEEFTVEPIAEGFNFVWIKVPEYSGAHDKKRVLNWIRFAWKLLTLPKVIADKPDAILYSSPALIPFLGAQRLAKKFKAKLAFEVRDIWPLSLVELGGFSKKHPFILLMQWIEYFAYGSADKVVSNLKNSVEHMVEHGMRRQKFVWVPNGFAISEAENKEALNAAVKSKLPDGKFIIGYTGSIGVANALSNIIQAADMLSDHADVAFVIVGGGQEREALEKLTAELRLQNVFFVNPIPKKQIQSMLAVFDVCFIGLTKDPLFRFGVSPNKLFDYFYSGKPLLYAIESGEYHPVDDAGAGIEVAAEDPQAIADAILSIKSLTPGEREQMGKNGRAYALEHHDYAKLAKKLEQALS